MITAVWKVEIKEGKRDQFMNLYNVFKEAEGFISCQFYPVIENEATLLAFETWESNEAHKKFMENMPKGTMGELFSMLEGRPESYSCTIGDFIKK